jgi:hypothetical protein
VNSLWADVATRIKWQRLSLEALVAVTTARRHDLARNIRVLSLWTWHDFELYALSCANLCFPRLHSSTYIYS